MNFVWKLTGIDGIRLYYLINAVWVFYTFFTFSLFPSDTTTIAIGYEHKHECMTTIHGMANIATELKHR